MIRPSSSLADPAQASPAPRVELRVTLSGRGRRADFEIDADAGASLGEVFGEAGFPVQPGEQVRVRRTGAALALTSPIADADLRHGDLIALEDSRTEAVPVGQRRAGEVEIVVSSGPAAGLRCPVDASGVILGRDATCGLQIDDQSLSRHHLEIRLNGGVVEFRDLDSRNGTTLEGRRVSPKAWNILEPGGQIEAGRSLITVEGHAGTRIGAAGAAGELVATRPPRVMRPHVPSTLELSAPPEPSHRAKFRPVLALIPLLGGVVLFFIFSSPAMLVFTALSPLMAVASWYSSRRDSREADTGREGRWRQELDQAATRLATETVQEAEARRAAAPDAGTLVARALRNRPELWERRSEDADFLHLRVGVADLPSRASVKLGRGGPPAMREEAERRLASYSMLPSVPVTVDIDGAVAGVCGEREGATAAARWLVAQSAVLHSPRDLVICAAVPEGGQWDWLGWLPHAHAGRSPWGGPLVVRDSAGAEVLLDAVVDLQTRRKQDREGRFGGERSPEPRVLCLVDEQLGGRRDLVEQIGSLAAASDVAMIYLGRSRADLPGTCRFIVEAATGPSVLSVTDLRTSETVHDVSAEAPPAEVCDQLARALAPIRDGGAGGGVQEIPARVSLLELLALPDPTPDAIESRWSASPRSLGAPVGIGNDGPVDLDLVERGPHGLVVGTTGSGKSEFLKALVAGLVATHPPDHLNLLLLDFKGGAAFLPFQGMPHVVGLASDLDGESARRALLSLKAEGERRQRLFNEHAVNDIQAMWELAPNEAPPYLLVAVDEFGFAEEAAPGFIDGMVAIARKGRSWGIHLLLANQQLDSNFAGGILKNTNLRVSLRVLADTESETVIGTKQAARLPETQRGRGFWRQGASQAEPFQGALVSGFSRRDVAAPVIVRPLIDGCVHDDGDEAARPAGVNDFDALRSAVLEAHARSGREDPPALWQPPLPGIVPLESVPAPHGAGVPIGMVDDPAARRHDTLTIDLSSSGHVLFLGPGGSGRTTALRTLAASLASANGPETVHLYAVDDGGRQLDGLRALPHCGDVIGVHDLERLELLLRRLVSALEERSSFMAKRGVGSVDDLPTEERPARIVLLLDGMQQFGEATGSSLLPHGELLGRVLGSGRPLGVHAVLTADRRSAVPPALQPHIGLRVHLRPSADDLLLAGISGASDVSDAPPGRGMLEDGRLCQIAVAGREPTRQNDALATLQTPAPAAGPVARPVLALPAAVSRGLLPPVLGTRVPIGISAPDHEPAYVDLSERHLLVLGALHSGRSTALTTIASALLEVPGLERFLVTPRRSPLGELEGWTAKAHGDALLPLLEDLLERMPEHAPDPWAVLVVDDGQEIQAPKVQETLDRVVRTGRDGGVRVVVASDAFGARIGTTWLRGVRAENHALLLMPQSKDDGALVGADIPLRPSAPWVPGRGWLVSSGAITLVQSAH